MHWARRAASRADCTAGSRSEIKIAMIAMTTSNSINVKPRRRMETPYFFLEKGGEDRCPARATGRHGCRSEDSLRGDREEAPDDPAPAILLSTTPSRAIGPAEIAEPAEGRARAA